MHLHPHVSSRPFAQVSNVVGRGFASLLSSNNGVLTAMEVGGRCSASFEYDANLICPSALWPKPSCKLVPDWEWHECGPPR